MGAQYNGSGRSAREGAGTGDPLSAAPPQRPLVLDGAVGTEIERRGLRCDLPLWSAWALIEAPEALREIHLAYARAGADWLTADTFRTQRRHLEAAGRSETPAALARRAVALAREAAAAAGGEPRVLASMAPLEDCYRPDRVPDDASLVDEHAEQARALAASGADALLLETLNCVREARIATAAARDTGLPCWVCFAVDARGRLLSGEPLAAALEAVARLGPEGVGVNCLAPSEVAAALPALRACGLPFSVHANLGPPLPEGGFREPLGPDAFAAAARGWIAAGARVIGGCCGTTPAHIRALAAETRSVTEITARVP